MLFLRTIWPSTDPDFSIEQDVTKAMNKPETKFWKNIKVTDNNSLIGYANIFDRPIRIGSLLVNNMALASVCVKTEYRKAGIGHTIIKKIFEFIDNKTFECSVFQTAVPEFYIKAGAKKIDNSIINSLNENKYPFWDPHVFIYPSSYLLSNEIIDLIGPGY
jgi:predicted N-acetyltransferase YhbS